MTAVKKQQPLESYEIKSVTIAELMRVQHEKMREHMPSSALAAKAAKQRKEEAELLVRY